MATTKNIRPVSGITCEHCGRLQSSDGRTAVYDIIAHTVTIGCEFGDCYKYSTVSSDGIKVRCEARPRCNKIDTLGVQYHTHDLDDIFGGN